MNELDKRRQEGFCNLICDMFRENPELITKNKKELEDFIHRAGIAIHNIPFLLSSNELVNREVFEQINELDPEGYSKTWGPWATRLASSFNQSLPELSQ